MAIDLVVVNASPLICLSKAGLDRLLPLLFPTVKVPASVLKEIGVKTVAGKAEARPWLEEVGDLPLNPVVSAWDLGRGESAVITLANSLPGAWAILDDKEARRCAKTMGCPFTGSLGVIVLAKRRGIIQDVRTPMLALRAAGLWVTDGLIEEMTEIAER